MLAKEIACEEGPLPKPTLVTVKQLAKAVPALSVSLIRRLLLNRENNGLDDTGSVIRVGHRLFLDQDLFMKWIVDSSKGLRVNKDDTVADTVQGGNE